MVESTIVIDAFKSPDDLSKLSTIKNKLSKEKSLIDTKLKSNLAQHLDLTRDSLRSLYHTRSSVKQLTNNSNSTNKDFSNISQVVMIHRNFNQVEETVNNLRQMYSKISTIESWLDADKEDPMGSNNYLIPIHSELSQLETFKNHALYQANELDNQSRDTLLKHFHKLNALIEEFQLHLQDLSKHILDVVRYGDQSVVERLVQIVEHEQREDEKVTSLKLVIQANEDSKNDRFKQMQANSRSIKNMKLTLIDNIKESVDELFDAADEQHQDDNAAFLETLDWIYEDFQDITDKVQVLFPNDFNIHQVYIIAYHTRLNQSLKRILSSEPESAVLLTLYNFVKNYAKQMEKLNIPLEWINSPPLLDGKEQDLIEDYVQLLTRKLDEWTVNLMKDEKTEFSQRSQPPEIDGDGLWGMQGAVILFQMINSQADLAANSGQGGVLARVITECSRVIRSVQADWTEIINSESIQMNKKPEFVANGLGEYLIALANDQIKAADFTESLLQRTEVMVSDKYKTAIQKQLNDAMDGSLDVARKCIEVIVSIIFSDLKPAIKGLFGSAWFEESLVIQMLETMRDYLDDWSEFMNVSLRELLVESLMHEFLVTYLRMLKKCSKIKVLPFVEQIKADTLEAHTFFKRYRKAGDIQDDLDILERVVSLLTSSESMIYLDYFPFAKRHGPCLQFVQSLIKARDDLERRESKDMIETIYRKAEEEQFPEPDPPTIMSRIN
ncbi:vesicle fusion-related protein [Wallemia mellicola]|nr:vesicle fusion-related protein [Wallemia mellicola]